MEAYSFSLSWLVELNAARESMSSAQQRALADGIEAIKISMENHEQNTAKVTEQLAGVNEVFQDVSTKGKLTRLIHDIATSDYTQTPEEKFENPFARRAESELGVMLLTNPTTAMMTSVGRISEEIIKLMDDQSDYVLQRFSQFFAEDAHVIALGAPKVAPTPESVKKILRDNNTAQLAEIMHIHFKFSQAITREVPIRQAPQRKPVGRLADITAGFSVGGDDDFFRSKIADASYLGRVFRAYISDELMYRSPLYTAFQGRGRAGTFDQTRTHQLGLMLRGQERFEVGLPTHSSAWAADCKSQPADLTSPYVTDLINNDAVYVAGPSGMTSMFLNQMEVLANFENEELKKNYLSAVVAYIVGGGFHSLHEVIGPAQYALNIVPGYNIQKPSHEQKAPAPNYHQFFAQQALIDSEFGARREAAWDNYLTYLSVLGFYKVLDKLEQNVIELEGMARNESKYIQPAKTARALHLQLTALGAEFFNGPKTPDTCWAFKIRCGAELDRAKSVLKDYRGWADFLQDLVFVVTSIVTMNLANVVNAAAMVTSQRPKNVSAEKIACAEATEKMAEFKQEFNKIMDDIIVDVDEKSSKPSN